MIAANTYTVEYVFPDARVRKVDGDGYTIHPDRNAVHREFPLLDIVDGEANFSVKIKAK